MTSKYKYKSKSKDMDAKIKIVSIFTDGSAVYTYKGNVRRTQIESADYGGIGVYFAENDIRNVSQPYYLLPITNQRTELYAAIKAIENFMKFKTSREKAHLIIYTDSKYLIGLITMWIKKWKLNRWKTVNGKDVKNKDLIYWLDSLISLYKDDISVDFKHVKAHVTGKNIPKDKSSQEYRCWYGNYMADKVARAGTTLVMKHVMVKT